MLKKNYRPVSILSNFSKIYEKLMYNQLYDYFENMRKTEFVALLTDLSKAFDYINHPLLITELFNYVSPLSINMIFFLFEQSDTSNQNQ